MPNPRLEQIILSRRKQLYADAEKEIQELERILGLSREDVLALLKELEEHERRYGGARLVRDAAMVLAGTGMLWSSLRNRLGSIYQATIEHGWELGVDAVEAISAHMGEVAPRAVAWTDVLKRNVIPFADKQTLAIESRIRGELVRGVLNGDSVQAISDRLIGAGLGTDGTPWKSAMSRADTTVITETSRAYHSALTGNFNQADWVDGYQWMTFPDGPWPCAQCAPLHGRFIPKGSGPIPPLHPRCRCSLVVVTKKYGTYDLTMP